jgi:hemoglobin/transferrin/lactoferrin receptor protein
VQYVSLRSTIADNSFFNFPFTEIKQTPLAVTGNIGLVFLPSENFRVTSNISSGFRAPNIDDAARVFESASATRRLIVPNPDVAPEYTYNFDFGFSYKIEDKARVEFTGFYTLFKNAVALAPFKLNGQDSVLYNSITSAVYSNQNVNKAYLRGMNARLLINLSKKLVWDNTISHTFGRYINSDGSKKPMDHIPPVFGKSGITYNAGKLTWEAWMLFNGWKRISDYNPDGEDNGQYATVDGMPSWVIFNWKAAYAINQKITVQAGVENIADRNYRYFASGFSAPGRNFYASLRINW